MKISTRGRYAMRMMVCLGRSPEEELLPLKEISNRIHVNAKYLEQIAATLSRAGLIHVARGSTGGYRLNRAPEAYTAWEILHAVEGSLSPVACLDSAENACEYADRCSTLPFWKELDSVVETFLREKTLQDIIDSSTQGQEHYN